MKVILSDHAGFCWGVKRAIRLTEESLDAYTDRPIYASGDIIHNRQVNELFSKKGLMFESDITQYDSRGVFIVRSHGLAQNTRTAVQEKGLEIIDTTCPFVDRVRKRLEELLQDGYYIVVCGKKGHPEVSHLVEGLKDDQYTVARNSAELESSLTGWNTHTKIGLISQTTQSQEMFDEIQERLQETCTDLRIYNTICHATIERQSVVRELAPQCDAMIVVGGKNSSNTKNLLQICLEYQPHSIHIEDVDELQQLGEEWFKNINTVGVTAGASTPDNIIDSVVTWLKNYSDTTS